MSTLFKSVLNFFIQDDWNYTEIEAEKAIRLEVTMENSNYSCYAITDEENKVFQFYANSPVKVPEDKYLQISEFLTRANYGLILGNFELDFSDGEVRYKTSIYMGESELDFPIIKRMVYLNLSTMDDYFPAIMKVIYGGISPEQAIQEVEQYRDAEES